MIELSEKSDAIRQSQVQAPETARIRLHFLDGMRGASALFVVLHHIHQEATYRHDLPAALLRCTKWLQLGHYGVAVFIVLSGYSLMLPIARTGGAQLPGGWSGYLRRRARRILPPYYAALLVSLLLFSATPQLHQHGGWRADLEIPAFSWGAIVSHLFLVHNVTPWALKINSPMWSVGTEWQIYFLFPLLLLPVLRRFGCLATVACGFAVGTLPYMLAPQVVANACPWYLGLFALGMVAAVVSYPKTDEIEKVRQHFPWFTFAVLSAATLAVCIKMIPDRLVLNDAIAGVAAASLMISLASTMSFSHRGVSSALRNVLSSRPLVMAGAFSYSLYLIHSPVLSLMHIQLRGFGLSPLACFVLLFTVGFLIILGVATLFHLLFERPFMSAVSSDPNAAQQKISTEQPQKI